MEKQFSEERLREAADIIEDYIEYLKENEPDAANSISLLEAVLMELM